MPDELMEAARIDGAGPIEVLQRTSCCRCRRPTSRRFSSSSFIYGWNQYLCADPRHDRRQLPERSSRASSACPRRGRQRTAVELHHVGHGSGHGPAGPGSSSSCRGFFVEGPRGQREITMAELKTSRCGQDLSGRRQRREGRVGRHRGWRVHRAGRPLGLRQVHDPADDRRAGNHHRRRGPRSRAAS